MNIPVNFMCQQLLKHIQTFVLTVDDTQNQQSCPKKVTILTKFSILVNKLVDLESH